MSVIFPARYFYKITSFNEASEDVGFHCHFPFFTVIHFCPSERAEASDIWIEASPRPARPLREDASGRYWVAEVASRHWPATSRPEVASSHQRDLDVSVMGNGGRCFLFGNACIYRVLEYIWIDKREDCITVLCGHKISLYTGRPSGQRTEDCPPRRCSGTPSCPDATSGPSSPDAYYSDRQCPALIW